MRPRGGWVWVKAADAALVVMRPGGARVWAKSAWSITPTSGGSMAVLGHSTAGSAGSRAEPKASGGIQLCCLDLLERLVAAATAAMEHRQHRPFGEPAFSDFYKRIFTEQHCVGKSQKTSRSILFAKYSENWSGSNV